MKLFSNDETQVYIMLFTNDAEVAGVIANLQHLLAHPKEGVRCLVTYPDNMNPLHRDELLTSIEQTIKVMNDAAVPCS